MAEQANIIGGQAKAVNSHVKYGVYGAPGDYAGKSVAEVRQQMASVWQVPNDAVAYKGKEKLDNNYVIQPGDQIEFHRKMGEKG